MANCIDLAPIMKVLKVDLKKDNVSISNAEKAKKPYKFDTHDITPDMYYDMFFGTKTGKENAFSRIKKVVKNNAAENKLFGATKNVDTKNPLFADLFSKDATAEQKIEAGKRMQIRGLAMKHLTGTIKSDRDVQNNLDISEEEAQNLLYTGGSRKVATIGMATALGRDIAYSMGFKMKMSPDLANAMYNKIGMQALEELQENTGLVKIDTNDYIINNDFMDDKYSKYEKNSNILSGHTTIRIDYDKLAKETKTQTKEEVIKDINDAFEAGRSLEILGKDNKKMATIGLVDGSSRYVQRMSVPSNLAVPTPTYNVSNTGKDITMSAENLTLLNNMQKIPAEVNPRVGQFFLYLNGVVEEAKKNQLVNSIDYDFESIIKEAVGNDAEILNFVFGTFDTLASVDSKNKAIGQSLSKTSTVQTLIEDAGRYFNEDGSAKPVFMEHEMYRTGRVGYVQSVMNAQTDKFFSRFVLDGGEYTIDTGGKEWKQLINGIKDDSGLDVGEILGETGSINDGLEFLIKLYNDTYSSGLTGKKAFQAQNKFHKILNDGRFREAGVLHKIPKLKGSLWQKLSSIEAVADVRNGTNNKITTRFQTKPDATGSGIILQLLQMIGMDGSHKGALGHLERLGLVKGKDGDVDDVYGFLQDAIKSSMKPLVVPEKDKTLSEEGYKKVGDLDMTKDEYSDEEKSNIFIQKMINLGIAGDLRDIAKPATMITSYLAGEATVKAETGEAYTQSIFDVLEGRNASPEQVKFISDVLKSADEEMYNTVKAGSRNGKITANTLMNTPGVKSSLEQYLSATVGQHMYTLIGESLTTGSMKNFQKKIMDVYKSMQKIAERQDELIAEGKADPSTAFQLRTLPAQIVMDMKDFPNSDSWWNMQKVKNKKTGKTENVRTTKMTKKELLDKYGMMITSPSQTLEDVLGDETLVMREGMNALTSLVNVVHSMDSAIMFRAHRKTRAKMGLPAGEGSYTASIHDANNSDAKYNAVFQDMYREAIVEVVQEYDMYSQMASAYETMVDSKSPENTAEMSDSDFKEMMKNSEDGFKAKQQLINDGTFDLASDKTFGFKDELDRDTKKKPKPEPEPEPTVETETQEETEETTEEEYEWNKNNPIPWKEDAPKNKSFLDFFAPGAIEKSYNLVKDLVDSQKVWYVYDTETNAKSNQLPIQMGMQKMKGNKKVGEPVEFYFSVDKISEGAAKVHGITPEKLEAKIKEQNKNLGTTSNKEVLAHIEKLTGGKPMVAYNAKFDAQAMQNLETVEGNTGGKPLNLSAELDAAGALVKIGQDQDVKMRRSTNTLKDMAERVGLKWDDKRGHDAVYDVLQTVDTIVAAFADPKNSMRQRADGSVVYDKAETSNKPKKKRDETVTTMLERIRKASPTLDAFMNRNSGSKNKFSWHETTSHYEPSNHTIAVRNSDALTDAQLRRILEHEIYHHDTLAFLHANPEDVDVKHLMRVVQDIKKNKDTLKKNLKGKRSLQLLEHMTEQKSDLRNLAELTAIFKTETQALKAFATALGDKQFEPRMKRLIRKIKEFFTGKDNMQSPFSPDEVMASVEAIGKKGTEFEKTVEGNQARLDFAGDALNDAQDTVPEPSPQRKAFMKKLKYKPYEPVESYEGKIPYVEDGIRAVNNFTSSVIGDIIVDGNNVYLGQKQFQEADKYLTENFPIYAANREMMLNYAESPTAQRMKGFLDPARFGDRMTMEQLISAQDKATQERGSIDNALIANMKSLMKNMTPEQVETIYNITSKAPIFNLRDGLMKDLVQGTKNLDKELDLLDAKLDRTDRVKAERMADMLIGKEGHVLNLHDSYNSDTAGLGDNVKKIFQQVVALRVIKSDPEYKAGLELLNANTELYNLIVDASKGLKERHDLLYQQKHQNRKGKEKYTDAKRYRENLISDIFEEEYDIEGITAQELAEGLYSTDNGWMLLRKPHGKNYGIMYRKSKDETYQQGAGTTISYKHTDVIIPKSKQMPNPINALSTDVGQNDKRHKVVLTEKEKNKLGLQKNPADAIYRSFSRILEIESTQQARDMILSNEFTNKVRTEKDLTKFDKELGEMKPEDRKWLVALPNGIKKSDIVNKDEDGKYKYPNIQKYYKVPERASSVGNFRHNFDLVRIDAEPWLTGYKDAILFENHPGARRVAYTVRQMVKWTKITWTALSPIKIMNDAISNSLVLLGYDVPPAKIAKYGKEINKQIGEFEQLRLAELKAKIHGNKAEEKRIAKQIENHPMAMMMYNGMLQSINIELFQRDASVVTGVQKDIEELLNKHILLPGGEKSSLFKGIEYLQKHGDFGLESILEFASKNTKNVKQLEALALQLEASEKKIKNLRESEKEEVMAKYVSEFLMTPQSEAVQFGSTLVQRADIIARGVLVRHMMDEGKSESEAVLAATDAFINYKQNMPKELKILSDYGVLLFPSFWMRIQRVIWSLLKRNPATAVAALSMEELIQMNVATVFDANLVAKYNDGMFGLPPVMGFWQ